MTLPMDDFKVTAMTRPAPEDTTFENAGDLRFSDLGPPSERAPTEEGAERRRAADAEAVWTAQCPSCGVKLSGSRELLASHKCHREPVGGPSS